MRATPSFNASNEAALSPSEILVVGSLAYDSITTPYGKRDRTLGGSANYFSLAASLMAKVNVVGVVGEDYDEKDVTALTARGVRIDGLQRQSGRTFFWEGKYEAAMNDAITLKTELNVFENFRPVVPKVFCNSKFVFLANIDPALQLSVLEQIEKPVLVGADTMNYWITSKRKDLDKLIERIDILLINEGELRQLTDSWNTVAAAKAICELGPKAVVVKRGEYGFMLFGPKGYFVLPAFPIDNVVDPTGAGDTFAGGFFGYLASHAEEPTWDLIRRACVQGCLLASFTVQDFGVEGIQRVKLPDVEQRLKHYLSCVSYPLG
jgi:sugar/nucleoside kinase (ribokinase family)